MRMTQKRAVVTGAGKGIGEATALMFAREGASVVVADLDAPRGREVKERICTEGAWAEFIETDVRKRTAVETLVVQARELLGGIDVWVNNAGGTIGEELLDMDERTWQEDLDLNLTSQYLCCRAVLPVMIEQRAGSIINISSVNALWSIGEFAYSAAKAAVISLTKNIAVTHGPQGVRANVICPGTIETKSGGAYWDQKIGGRDKLVRWYPVRRLGRPEDVAHLCVYLGSDESSFMTGATLVLDGGLTAGSRLFGTV